jgi:Carboxypeptidase regulatory-like domain
MIQRALPYMALAFALAGCTVDQTQPVVPVGTLTGVITGPSGPVSGASVEVTAADGSQHRANSTADGYFELDRVPAGTIHVSVTAAGFAPWETNAIISPNATLAQDVRLTPV